MPKTGELSREAYIATYQSFDRSNTTVGLMGLNYQAGERVSLNAGMGYTTNFKDNPGLIFEGKGKYTFKDDVHSVQLRVRSSHSGKSNTTQFRVSPGYQEKLGKNTSIYINPYGAAKVDWDSGNWTTDVGVFGGVTQKLSKNVSLSAEFQRYDLIHYKNNSPENWGFNAVLSYKF